MNTSPTIAHIAPALIRAQKNIGAASKEAKNPFFSSTYADLGSVMAVCKEPLLAEGISVLQPITTRENGDITLETILLHESGEFIGSSMKITPPKRMVTPKSDKERFEPYLAPDPQAEGSAITYARRYALQALVFIPSVDDDAEWAERALRNRPLEPEVAAKVEAKIEALVEQGGQAAHKEAMELEKGLQKRSPESIAIAAYETEHPEHRNKVANATQDDKGNWTFTLIGGEKKPAKEAPAARKSTPKAGEGAQPDANDHIPMSFRDVECHVGPNPGKCFGRKLGDIFNLGDLTKQPNTEKQVDALLKWFVGQSLATSPEPKDRSLLKAAEEAAAARKAELAAKSPQKAPEPEKAADMPPEPAQAAQEPVAAQGWKEYVVPGKHPDYSGKKLGELSPEIIRRISAEYLPLIDWTKATLPQKSLKAKVALAMADIGESLPLVASEEPPHTTELKKRIRESGLNRNDFFKCCHRNGYIADDAQKVEDISEADAAVLLEGWDMVAKETLAEQP